MKAVQSCYPTIAQAHERSPIINDSISCSQSAGMEARIVDDHLPCHDALDWLPFLIVVRVSRRFECGSRALDPARV